LSVDQEQEELALFLAKNIEQERYLDLIGETTYNISILQTAEENKIPDHQVLTHLQLPFSQLFSLYISNVNGKSETNNKKIIRDRTESII
jgi:rRNA maturation protein Rpf1